MRIGLIGCGAWGRNILRDLVAIGVDVGVVARSPQTRAAAVEGGAEVVWPSIDAIDGVAGIIVATPTSTHAEVIAKVLSCGVPVFTEKPMAMYVDAARTLADAAPDQLFVMHKWRYHRGIEEMGRRAGTNVHGGLRSLRIAFSTWERAWPDVDAAWILLPHMLSICLEVIGSVPELVDLSGRIFSTGDLELVARLGHGSGPVVVVDACTVRPGHQRTVTARFDEAVLTLGGGYDTHLTAWTPRDGASRIEFEDAMPLFDELAAFVAFLGGGSPPRSSAVEGAAVVSAVDEMVRALAP